MGRPKRPVGKPTRVRAPKGGSGKKVPSSLLDTKPRHFLLTAVKIENTGNPENVADGLWNAIHGALTTLPSDTQNQVLTAIRNKIDLRQDYLMAQAH